MSNKTIDAAADEAVTIRHIWNFQGKPGASVRKDKSEGANVQMYLRDPQKQISNLFIGAENLDSQSTYYIIIDTHGIVKSHKAGPRIFFIDDTLCAISRRRQRNGASCSVGKGCIGKGTLQSTKGSWQYAVGKNVAMLGKDFVKIRVCRQKSTGCRCVFMNSGAQPNLTTLVCFWIPPRTFHWLKAVKIQSGDY